MNRRIIRTLVGKEAARLVAQRSALALAALLLCASVLLRVYGSDSPVSPRISTWWIDYWEDGPLIEHLRANVPTDLRDQIRFRNVSQIPTDRNGVLQYGHNEASIQIRPLPPLEGQSVFKVWVWYSSHDGSEFSPTEDWFWRETNRYYGHSSPRFEVERSALHGLDLRGTAAVGLTLFAMFFVCVCVMPSMTCEEKERGTFAAQALSPASVADAVAAKAIVYVPVAVGLASLLAGIVRPDAPSALLCAAMSIGALAAFGLGLAVAALAPTQRAAGTAALCYALAAAIVVALLRRANIPFIPDLMLETRLPSALAAALGGNAIANPWRALGLTGTLAGGWLATGGLLFARSWRFPGRATA